MQQPEERIEYDPDKKDYTARELEILADQFLMDDAKSIGEDGQERGIKGDNPILFEVHLKMRRSREIQTTTGQVEDHLTVNKMGQPGMYWRQEPHGGRRVNSDSQRRKNGSSYYGS